MCGSSKNTTTQKSSQTTAPNSEAMEVYRDLLGRLKTVGADTYTPYAGTRVADFSPEQQALIQQMMQPGGATNDIYQNVLNQAGQGYDPLKQEDIARFQNPYIDQVVNATMTSMDRGFDRDVSKLKGDAIMANAFGGDRAGIAEATLRSQQGDQRAKMEADLRAQGFDMATAKALQELQTRNAARGQGLNAMMGAAQGINQGYTQAFGAGEAQRGLEQAKLDVPFEQYLEQRAFPYQQLQFLSGIGTGVGSQMGGTSSGKQTTTTPGPNMFSQILGAGLGIAGLGTGTIGGSLLGFADGGRVQAEARSYEPTWRDMIATYLLGEGKPAPELANLVENLLGSRGMGTTGTPGLIDMTPAGAPLNLQESVRHFGEGDTVGGVLNLGDAAFSMLPAGSGIKHSRNFLENFVDRQVAKEIELTYPHDVEFHPGELSHLARFSDNPPMNRIDPKEVDFLSRVQPSANQNSRLLSVGRAEGGAVGGTGTILEDAVAMANRLKEERRAQGRGSEPELRNLDTSTIDKFAAWLLGNKPSPEMRNLVEGFTGSTGLGEASAPGIVDLIPGISQAINAEQAYRDASSGNALGAIGDAAEAVLPFAAAAKLPKLMSRTPKPYSDEFLESLPLGARIDTGGGRWTPAHHDVAGNVFRKDMANPDKAVSSKTLEGGIRSTMDRVGLDAPDDIAARTSATLNDFAKYPAVREVGIKNLTPKLISQILKELRRTSPEKYLSLVPGLAYATDELSAPDKAEGGAVEGERNWLGLDPATSRALFSAGMAMMAGRSPHFGPNVGVGGLAGLQSYDDYVKTQDDMSYRQKKLDQDRELDEERLRLMREQLKVKPEFDVVKDVMTKDGRPVVLNKATGRYHDASTGEPIDPNTGVSPIKKKYSDLPVGVQKEIMDTRNIIQSSGNAISNLVEASKLNEQAYSGPLAGERGWIKSLTEGEEGGSGTATEQLDNIITSGALESLKATFGAAPTEGERKILLDIQGSVSKAPQVRAKIFKRAIAASLAREEYNKRKAAAMVDGSYFTEGFDQEPLPLDSYLDVAEQLMSGGKGEEPLRKQFKTKDGSLKWGISKDGGKTWEPE
jgi:hypothetical protein